MILWIRHMPLNEFAVSSSFGMRDFMGYWWHNGLDLRARKGTKVYAVNGGCVKAVGNNPAGYGIYAVVNHGSWSTLYAHLSEVRVKEGDRVEAGGVLGLSGNTGVTSGPHLHFEIRLGPWNKFWDKVYLNGTVYLRCIDPEPLLRDAHVGTFMSVAGAEETVRCRAGLEDKTVSFMKSYKYSDDLFMKLAKCMM